MGGQYERVVSGILLVAYAGRVDDVADDVVDDDVVIIVADDGVDVDVVCVMLRVMYVWCEDHQRVETSRWDATNRRSSDLEREGHTSVARAYGSVCVGLYVALCFV